MPIKIAFTDFWKDFSPMDNWFYHFLSKHFDIQVVEEDPDCLIYSCFGYKHLKYRCIKICYLAENIRPNFLECDYALGFDYINRNNYYRLPLYGIWDNLIHEKLILKKPSIDEFLSSKTKFCCMLVSNPKAKKRNDFFHKLSKYKKVDSGGRHLNNIGFHVNDKMDFIKDYKFIISFENSSYPGYVTEKVYQPMFTNTIPIYWGTSLVNLDFNTKSFVNWHDYNSDEKVIDRIIELDQDINAMKSLLMETWFRNNQINSFISELNVKSFFQRIFNTNKIPIAGSWIKYPALISRKSKSFFRKFLN